MKKIWLLLLALPCAAMAQEREWMPYKDLIEATKLDQFYALPPAERDKIHPYIVITPNNKAIKPSDITLTVLGTAGKQPLPAITADGRLDISPNPAWMAENAKIWTTIPKGEKSKIGFGIDAVMPEGTQWQYATLMGSVAQVNRVIGTLGGALSMFVPKVKSVVLKFKQPTQLTIAGKGGERRYTSDAKGQIRLKPDDALLQENPAIRLSARPFEAELDTE